MQAIATEARVMAAVDDRDRKIEESFHGGAVVNNIRTVELVEERAVVHGVAGEERAGGGFPQPDRAG